MIIVINGAYSFDAYGQVKFARNILMHTDTVGNSFIPPLQIVLNKCPEIKN